MSKKITTKDFIDRARTVHGTKYGYAFSVYQSSKNKVFIHCLEHGMFEQSPNHHLRGVGCPACFGTKKHTTESFIQKAREVHGEKYSYYLVEYSGTHSKVTIICEKHGIFEQTPAAHLSEQGCLGCAGVKKHTDDSFITLAREVHGENRYRYELVVYTGNKNKIIIICPEHGDFKQKPADHLNGKGCPGCSGNTKHTSQLFSQKAKQIHGENRYKYELVEYKNNSEKVKIVCHEHGVFEQKPAAHLSGQGCPGCANYGFDRTKYGFLYILRSDCGRYMKIGITHKPDQRQSDLSKATPFSFKRIELIEGPGDQIATLEKELLADYQPVGFTETFNGYSEWRLWDDSILMRFRQHR